MVCCVNLVDFNKIPLLKKSPIKPTLFNRGLLLRSYMHKLSKKKRIIIIVVRQISFANSGILYQLIGVRLDKVFTKDLWLSVLILSPHICIQVNFKFLELSLHLKPEEIWFDLTCC